MTMKGETLFAAHPRGWPFAVIRGVNSDKAEGLRNPGLDRLPASGRVSPLRVRMNSCKFTAFSEGKESRKRPEREQKKSRKRPEKNQKPLHVIFLTV